MFNNNNNNNNNNNLLLLCRLDNFFCLYCHKVQRRHTNCNLYTPRQ